MVGLVSLELIDRIYGIFIHGVSGWEVRRKGEDDAYSTQKKSHCTGSTPSVASHWISVRTIDDDFLVHLTLNAFAFYLCFLVATVTQRISV